MSQKLVILGAGSWGTALAVHFNEHGHEVSLVPRFTEDALAMLSNRENKKHLPCVPLKEDLQIILEMKPALLEADMVILAPPSFGLKKTCLKLKKAADKNLPPILVLSKGLDRESLKLPLELVESILPKVPCGILSGPSGSAEVASQKPTSIVLGSTYAQRHNWVKALNSKELLLVACEDPIGVQLGGALKNIYAIGAGILDGLRLGDNAKATYLTVAAKEMVEFAKHLGASENTLYGLSGLGDFMATCYGAWSRNHQFGQALGESQPITTLLKQKNVVEGYWASDCFYRLAKKKNTTPPRILSYLHKVLHEKLPINKKSYWNSIH